MSGRICHWIEYMSIIGCDWLESHVCDWLERLCVIGYKYACDSQKEPFGNENQLFD